MIRWTKSVINQSYNEKQYITLWTFQFCVLLLGLGFCTALDLASRGARVILACRNLQKAEDARKKILKELQSNCDVIVRHLDLSSMKSVRQFVRETFEQESRLDILINNAAVSGALNVF